MVLYNRDTKLSESIMTHPNLIPVINRLGIRLGVGDLSIEEICRRYDMDTEFFLSVVNTYLNEDYFPVNAVGAFSLEKTIDYLKKTNSFYLRIQLPNIDRHFASLLERSGEDNNLYLLKTFYEDMRIQLRECLMYDEDTFFPALADGCVGIEDCPRNGYAEVEEKLHDLLFFFVEHLRGDYDANLCTAVVTAVFSLERDICQNNRIRSRILLPLVSGQLMD